MTTNLLDRRARRTTLRTAAVTAITALGVVGFASSAVADETLTGSIQLQAGGTTSGTLNDGSSVRLYEDNSSPKIYYNNPSSLSAAVDDTYTPIANGTAGLDLGSAQAAAAIPFDGFGNALTNHIVTPRAFSGVNFALTTTSAPVLQVADYDPLSPAASSPLTYGNVPIVVQWGGGNYPTPGNSATGNLTGTVTWDDPTDRSQGGDIVVEWDADITVFPFAGYHAKWQFEGRYVP